MRRRVLASAALAAAVWMGVSGAWSGAGEAAGAPDLRAFDGRASTFLARLKEAGLPVCRLVDLADLRVPRLPPGADAKSAAEELAKASGLRLDWIEGRPLLWRPDPEGAAFDLHTAEGVWRAGWSGDRSTVQKILAASAGADAALKRACAEAMLRFGRAPGAALLDREKAEALVRLGLADSDWLLRRQAVIAAVDLKLPDAAVIVEQAAGEKHAEILRGAALAAGRLGGEKGAAILERLADGGAVEKRDLGRVQFAVVHGCAELGGSRAVAILEKLAQSPNAYLGVWASRTAGSIRAPEALAFLRKQAESKDPRQRRGAALGLGACRESDVVELLKILVQETPKEGERVPAWSAAAMALGRQGGPAAFDALKAGWDRQGSRLELVYGVGLCGTPEAKAFLGGLAAGENERIRRAALWSLGRESRAEPKRLKAGDLEFAIRAERPRLFIRADNSGGWTGPSLAQMRENFRRPDYQQAKRKDKLPGTETGQVVLWLVSGDEFAGLDAATSAAEAVDGGINRARGETPSYAGISVERAAAVYDWLHGHGDIAPAARRLMMHHLEDFAAEFCNGWLKAKQATVFYSRRWGAAAATATVALALHGDSPLAGEMAEYMVRQLHDADGLFSIRQAQDGATAGSAYGLHHLFTDCANTVAAVQSATDWDAAGFIRKERGDWLQKQLLFQMHCTYPDGSFLKAGDLWNGANERDQYRMQVDVVMSLYQSGLARAWADQMEKRWPDYWPSDYHTEFVWQYFVFNDPGVKPAAMDQVPRCQLFSQAVDGFALWRSSWAPDATVVHFQCGDTLDMHGHRDQGKFVIYRQKPLADKKGAYIGYGSPLHSHFTSARSANVVIFDDGKNGGNQVGYIDQAGGVASFKEFQRVRPALGPPTGRIAVHEVTDRYARAVGVLDGSTPDKGARNKWTRELVFLDYKYLLVLDRVAAAPGVKCHWQLNFDREPTVAEGTIRYDDAPARLFCKTLLPDKPAIKTAPYVWPTKDIQKTQYAVEVSGPDPAAAEQVFLHVLYAADTKTDKMPECSFEKKGEDFVVKVGELEHTFKPVAGK